MNNVSLEKLGESMLRSRVIRNKKNIRYYMTKMLLRVVIPQLRKTIRTDNLYDVMSNDVRSEIEDAIEHVQSLVDTCKHVLYDRDEWRQELNEIVIILSDIITERDVIDTWDRETDTNYVENIIHVYVVNTIKRLERFIEQYLLGNKLFIIDLKKDLYGGHTQVTK